MQIVTTGMEAAFGNMWAKKEYEVLNQNFKGFEFVMFTFTTVIFSCVGVLIIPFIRRYTIGITDVEYCRIDLAVLITVAEAFYCIRQPYMTLVQATGHYKETKNGSAVEAILNLAISLLLINYIGITGVIIGTLVANLFHTIQYSYFISKKVLNRSIIEVLKRIIWTVGTSFMIVLISLMVTRTIVFSKGWLGWIFEAVIVFVISCIVSLIASVLFYKNDLKFILSVGKRMIKR